MPRKNGYEHHDDIRGMKEAWSKSHGDGTFTLAGYQKANGSSHYTLFVARVPNNYKNLLRGIIPLVRIKVEDYITLEPETSIEDAREEIMAWIEDNPDGLDT